MTGENNLGRDLASIDAFYKKNPELNVKAPMTETHSLGEWEGRFDELDIFQGNFAHGITGFKDGCHAIGDVRKFIRETLLAQKEGFRREIEEIIDTVLKSRTIDETAYGIGKMESTARAQAAIDIKLLTKLDTNCI